MTWCSRNASICVHVVASAMPCDVIVVLLLVPHGPRSSGTSRENDSLGLRLTRTLREALVRQFSTGDVLDGSKEKREDEEYDGETRTKML